MSTYTSDELIRLALVEVKLQNQVFAVSTPEQQRLLEDRRNQYADARREILMKTPCVWATKQITLNKIVIDGLEGEWYRLPADFIAFEDPGQIVETTKDPSGGTVYKLKSSTFRYFADLTDEDRDPLFQAAVRYRFLNKLITSEDSAAMMATVLIAKETSSYREWAASVAVRKDRLKRGRAQTVGTRSLPFMVTPHISVV